MKSEQQNFQRAAHPKNDEGHYWVSNDAMRIIREKCQRPTHGIAMYAALSLIATDFQARTFHITDQQLSKLSGISQISIIPKVLQDMASAGVISIEAVRGVSAHFDNVTKVTLLGEIRL
jgi:hypothetical protein